MIAGIATGILHPRVEYPVKVPVLSDGQVDEPQLLRTLQDAGAVAEKVRSIGVVFIPAVAIGPNALPTMALPVHGASYFLVDDMSQLLDPDDRDVVVHEEMTAMEEDEILAELTALTELLEKKVQAGALPLDDEPSPHALAWIRPASESDVVELVEDYLDQFADANDE
ncbi:MAG: hypothetical protein H0X64_07875 [Gemmatimonadaceae bacterium]|nr:hypothetical protein [Gemmatimonadaceae bacterium]